MPNTYKDKGRTGKSTRKALNTFATHLVAPVVHEDDFGDKAHAINDQTKSGKRKGAMVIVSSASATNYKLGIAVGSKDTDSWFKLSSANVTIVTPTA